MDGNKNRVDFIVRVTRNQAVWFDARTGNGTSQVNRFPAGPANGFDNPFLPGGAGPYRRGLLVCWAADAGAQQQVKWNHLSGTATLYYPSGWAYEYTAYAFFVPTGIDQQPVGTPGTLKLDGVSYDACPLYQVGFITPAAAAPAPVVTRTLVSDFGAGPNQGLDPFGVAVEASGTLVVIDVNAGTSARGALFRVDPVSGARTLVSDFGAGANQGFDPFDVAVEANGTLLVVDVTAGAGTLGALFRLDPITGARTLLSDFGVGPMKAMIHRASPWRPAGRSLWRTPTRAPATRARCSGWIRSPAYARFCRTSASARTRASSPSAWPWKPAGLSSSSMQTRAPAARARCSGWIRSPARVPW